MQVLGEAWRSIFPPDFGASPSSDDDRAVTSSSVAISTLSWSDQLQEMLSMVVPHSSSSFDAPKAEERRPVKESRAKLARARCALCGSFLKAESRIVFDVCSSCSLNATQPHVRIPQHALPYKPLVNPSNVPVPQRVWRATGPVSECIRACLAGHGYVLGSSSDWTIAWGSSLSSEDIEAMRGGQKHNHLPGWDSLNNKATLAEVAQAHRTRGSSLADNVPLTFVLPQDAEELLEHHKRGGGPYIVKPVGGTRGKGIRLMTALPDAFLKERRRIIVQEYVKRPHLLQGRKYDLRLYVAVTSSDPLRLYVHEQGYGRLCSEEYDLGRPQDLFRSACSCTLDLMEAIRHITNSNFQKFHELYALSASSSRTRPAGNKWHVDIIRREWEKEGNRAVWERIKAAITKVFIMFKEQANAAGRGVGASQPGCFSLFGIDVLLDDQLKPWLLELNSLPSTGTHSPLDIESREDPEKVKLQVCRLLSSKISSRWTRDAGSTRPSPVPPAPPSAELIRKRLLQGGSRHITPREIEMVQEYEEELARRRGWICCFPSQKMGQYATDASRRGGDAVLFTYLAGSARA